MKLTDDQRKRLTELIGECWHEPKGEKHCSCGRENIVNPYIHASNINRRFTTWPDLGAVMEAVVMEGHWWEFEKWSMQKFDKEKPKKTILELNARLIPWLIRPADEQGEAHFCRLVIEWMEENDALR